MFEISSSCMWSILCCFCMKAYNLMERQRRGLNSIRLKMKDGLLIVTQTDKSSSAIFTGEEYIRAGEKHTDKDGEVTMEYAEHNQQLLDGHMEWLSTIINICEQWNQMDRCRNNLLNHGLVV